MAEAAIIQVRDLTGGYDGQIIFQDVSFEVPRGSKFVILGGSGCGKSTLLKYLIGLYEPRQGEIFIDGMKMTAADPATQHKIWRRIGVMYQSGALFGSMTIYENIFLVLAEHADLPAEAMDYLIRIKLKLVGLGDAAEKMPAELSGGMQKRAAIARAMALDPEIIFLDEPSAGLDPITAADLDELILSLADSLHITFVVVTHELASIYTIADDAIMLDKRARGIIARGKPADLRDRSDNPWVRQFFKREPTAAVTVAAGNAR